MEDVHVVATSSGTWECKSQTKHIPASAVSVRIRIVRDGANEGNAYFDHIELRKLAPDSAPPPPPPPPPPEPTRSLPLTVSETNVSGDQTYRFTLSSTTEVDVVVSDQSTDIDCRINSTSCRNHGGTGDETWSGTLNAGTHTVTVYPFRSSGSYTLTVTGTSTARSPPLSVPEIPNFRLPSGGTVNTMFPAATGGTAPYVYRAAARDDVRCVNAPRERDAPDRHDRHGLHDQVHRHRQRKCVGLRDVRYHRRCARTAVGAAVDGCGNRADPDIDLDYACNG